MNKTGKIHKLRADRKTLNKLEEFRNESDTVFLFLGDAGCERVPALEPALCTRRRSHPETKRGQRVLDTSSEKSKVKTQRTVLTRLATQFIKNVNN